MGILLILFQMVLVIAWYVWPPLATVPAWLIFMPALWALLIAITAGTLPLLILIIQAAMTRRS